MVSRFALFLILTINTYGVFCNPGNQIRIVGGQSAGLGQFPYQISIRSESSRHFCGGSIIGDYWAITAAHCTYGRKPENTKIVVGTISSTDHSGVQYDLNNIINHKKYNPNRIENDISLLKTREQIQFNENVNMIPINTDFIVQHQEATISGWGQMASVGSAANTLQFLEVNTLSNQDCKNRFSPGNSKFIYDTSLCTFTKENEGACMGDSGGPLTVDSKLVGIVSWGIPCARGSPDVFTRVSEFNSWIQIEMNKI